jgi:hypothetical protein
VQEITLVSAASKITQFKEASLFKRLIAWWVGRQFNISVQFLSKRTDDFGALSNELFVWEKKWSAALKEKSKPDEKSPALLLEYENGTLVISALLCVAMHLCKQRKLPFLRLCKQTEELMEEVFKRQAKTV